MTIAYWIVAGITALAFLAAGGMKATRPKEALASSGMAWVEDFSATGVRLIGLAEFLGGVGLILPMLTGIAPILSPIAGIALAVAMVAAVVVHVRRKESAVPPVPLLILSAAAAVLGFLVLA